MKKIIVTTTINPPTEAVVKFDAMSGWEMIVIGDLKTPKDYKLKRGLYVTPAEQEKLDPELSKALGWNCIQRRNFGLLMAYKAGADIVAVIDDDNIPLENWGKDVAVGSEIEVNYYTESLPVFDPVGATNYPNLWHRGYPPQLLAKRNYGKPSRRKVKVDVQANFWNGDPDIDAICRMEHAPECTFDGKFFPMAADKPAPFNSQNTFLSREVLKDYFLWPLIGRMDDIWAAYYVQAKGKRVVYGAATVYQQRNVHDLTVDMRNEYIGYENSLPVVEAMTKDPEAILNYLPGKAIYAWNLYKRHLSHA